MTAVAGSTFFTEKRMIDWNALRRLFWKRTVCFLCKKDEFWIK